MASGSDNRVCIGRIAGAHGVGGWVRITSYTEQPENVGAYGPVSDERGARVFELEVMRMVKAHVVARIAGIEDRNAAEALRGVRLFVPRDRLPPAEPDEFYSEDLIGLAVETVGGTALGAVRSVQDFGAGAMLEVGGTRGRTVLVPFTRDVVPVIDLDAGRVVVDPPAGLLDEAADDGSADDRG